MINKPSDDSINKIQLLYIGSVLPDTAEFNTSAFSRAGSLYQRNLLSGMKKAGLNPNLIVSYRLIQSYPRSKEVFIQKSETQLEDGSEIYLLPFLNVTPIKQLSLGLTCLFQILLWGWHNRSEKKKVVYTYNLSVPPGLFTLLGARLIGAKAVVSLNDINIPGQTVPNTILNRLDFYLHRKLIPKFDGHIVASDEIKSDFCPDKQCLRLDGGVSHETINSLGTKREVTKPSSSIFHIVSAGTLDETNGIRVLLDAFSLLKDKNLRLSIAGVGPVAEEVIRASELDSRITYHGMLPMSDVFSLYVNADVLVNMRITKCLNTKYFFPSKMMEYLASGTPVITTSTGHTEEEFGSFVYLLKDESADGLATLINAVKFQPILTRIQLGESARNYMINNKTWDIQGRNLLNYLENILKHD